MRLFFIDAANTIADYYNYFGSTVSYEAFAGSGHAQVDEPLPPFSFFVPSFLLTPRFALQPTVNEGNLCSTSEDPYINRCNYDGAYEAMNVIYGGGLIVS